MMKRRQSLTTFSTKKARSESGTTELAIQDPNQSQALLPPPLEVGESSASVSEPTEDSEIGKNLPECWTLDQYTLFKEKYDGLVISNKKLGCKYCAKYGFANLVSVHMSKEWKHFQIEAGGNSKETQQASLRKKMKKHFSSKAHHVCKEKAKQCEQDAVTTGLDKMTEKYLGSTCRVFNTVYSLAHSCRPFSDIEDMVALQIKNGTDLGIGLHSRKTAVKIVDFIAEEIKAKLFAKIIERNLKICLIIDEASRHSSKAVVILFLKVEGSVFSPTIFVELVELEKQDAGTIFASVMESLNNVGFTKKYMKKNLIGFCSDGANVMLGRKSGVSARIAEEFPNIIIWHCLNHRLQLVLDEAIKEIKQVNHFKTFIDKVHTIHQSNKNQGELFKLSEQLEIEIMKIGRVLGPRWAACSLRSTLAVWRAYPVLHQFFRSKERYFGMAARLENRYFLTDLALRIDILNEISLLSSALQVETVDIIKAEKLVIRSIKAFEMLRKEKGEYEKKVDGLITSEAFQNIQFVENHRFVGLPRERLLESIVTNMKKRLMDCEHLKTGSQLQDTNKLRLLHFLKPDYWNIEEVVVPWPEAEEQLLAFSDIFHYEININDYRDFVENVLKDPQKYAIPDNIKKAGNIVRTIAVSSAEAERSFSKMNIIRSVQRTRLTVPSLSNLMTISVIGLPLEEWNPVPTVKKWLRAHHTADDAGVRLKKRETEGTNLTAIWEFLRDD